MSCQWIDIDDEDKDVPCQKPAAGLLYCHEHIQADNEFKAVLKSYVLSVQGKLSKEDEKTLKTAMPTWKKDVQEDLDLTAYKIKQIVLQLEKDGKDVDAIVNYLNSPGGSAP